MNELLIGRSFELSSLILLRELINSNLNKLDVFCIREKGISLIDMQKAKEFS